MTNVLPTSYEYACFMSALILMSPGASRQSFLDQCAKWGCKPEDAESYKVFGMTISQYNNMREVKPPEIMEHIAEEH